MSDILNEVADERISVNKKARAAKAKVRKHLVTTAYKNDVAEKLDKLAAAGHTVLSVTSSSEVRGFDVISYTEE
jgi:hypothetical protein